MKGTDGYAYHLAHQEGLDDPLCIADDILVIGEGTNDQEAKKDHDHHLVALMELCFNLD